MQTAHSPTSELTTSDSRPEPQAKAGFCRVDLVTVIGVLVLLGLVLTPALAHTRATDQAFVCRNNLGRLMIAWRMYSEDHNGQLCGAFQWVGGWLGYSAGNTDNTNYLDIINGPMGPYARNWMLWKCPADQSVAFEGGVLYPRVRTISMSQMFRTSSGGWTTAPPYRKYIKASDMIRPAPANLWVLVDENPDSVNDAAFGVRMSPYGGNWEDGPTVLHDGNCNFAFADGHTETHHWVDPRTQALKVTYSRTFPYGVSQPNNPDIQWVQDRTTAKLPGY